MIIGKFSLRILIMTILKMICMFILGVLSLCLAIIIFAFAYDYHQSQLLSFQVFGEEELLQNSKIRLISHAESKFEPIKIEHLLYLGKKYTKTIHPPISLISFLSGNHDIPSAIYISYKDELVNVIELKIWYKLYNHYMDINHIYLFKKDNTIKVAYITKEKNLERIRGGNNGGFNFDLIPKEEFYQTNNIPLEDIGKYELLFFNDIPSHLPR